MNLFEKLKNNRKLIEQSSGQGSLFGGLFGREGRRNRRGRQKGSKNKPKVVSNTVQTEIDFDEPRKKELANKVASKKEKLATRVKVEREKRRALKTGSDGKRARRQNPTTKKTVSQVKSDIEFQKGLKFQGGSGDIGYDAPDRASKVAKRNRRAIKQGTPDPFDIDTSKASKDVAKQFGTEPVKGGLKFGKPGTGVKDTIKNFQPRDISAKTYAKRVEKGLEKTKKPFRQFSRDLQDFKDRDVPGGPRTTRSKVKPSDVDNLSRQDVGMAPEDPPRKVVKQAEVSKQQAEYRKKIEKKRRGKKSAQNLRKIAAEKRAKRGVNPEVVTKTPFDRSKSRKKSQGPTVNFTDTDKPITYKRSGKVSGSRGIGNMYRGADGLGARRDLINRQITDAGAFSRKTNKFINVSTDADRVARKAVDKVGYSQRTLDFDTPSGAQGKPPKVTKLGKFRKLVQTAKKSKLGKAAKFVRKIPVVGDLALIGATAYGVNKFSNIGKSTPGSGSGTTNKKSTELKFDNPNDVTRTSLRDKTGKKIRVPLGSSTETINKIKNNSNNIRYYKNIPMNK